MTRFVWLVTGLLWLGLSSRARAADLPADCMPLADVRAGMTGEARSVVHGFQVDKYRVEILGVERGALGGSAMIMARVEGPSLEKHGIVAGMSGSPVFIDGKMIGAIAYGWSFAYNPIAGITPIEHMLTLWDDLDQKKPKPQRGGKKGGGANAASKGWDWKPDWDAYLAGGPSAKPEPLSFRPTSPRLVEIAGDNPMEMVPLSTPLFVSHASPATMGRLDKFFAARGLETLAAGSSAGSAPTPDAPSPPMVDGSAIGIPIMTGDLSISSMGTVTYRRGDKLIAFGHPMFGDGLIDAPMSQASMIGYMQSYSRSFKMGELRETVGTIRQDRQFGIGGVFGEAPDRVPVSVRAGGGAAAYPRPYKFSIWEDRDMLPMMAAIAMEEAFFASVTGGETTADCRYAIKLGGGAGKIEKSLRASARTGVTFEFFMGILQDLFLLMNNPYGQADVESIDVELDVRQGFRVDSLMQAAPRYATLKPGATLEIATRWQPYRGEEYEKRLEVKLPDDLEPGTYVVHVADGASAMGIDQRHDQSRFRPLDLEQTIDLAKRLDYPANRLSVFIFAPDLNLSVRGDSMQGAPDTIRGLIASTAPSETQTLVIGKKILENRMDFDFPIRAQASFSIDVQRFIPQ